MSRQTTLVLAAVVVCAALLWLWLGWRSDGAPAAPTTETPTTAAPADAVGGGVGGATDETDAGRVERTEVPAPPAPEPPYTVRGQVLADARAPRPTGMRVVAFRGEATDSPGIMMQSVNQTGGPPPFVLRGEPIAQAPVDERGDFVLRADHPHLRLSIEHDLYLLPLPEFVHVPTDTKSAEVVLSPTLGGCLRGRLFGARRGDIATVRVIAEPDMTAVLRDMNVFLGALLSMDRLHCAPDADGAFVFRRVVPGTPLTLAAEGDRAFAVLRQAPLMPGEVREVALPVQSAAELLVAVADAAGAPVERALVSVRPAAVDGGMLPQLQNRNGRTKADGTCVIPGLEPTRVHVEAMATGYTTAEATFDLAIEEEPQRLELTLDEGGVVTGVVRKPDGRPLEDARVAHHPSAEIPLIGDMAAQLGPAHLARVAEGGAPTEADGSFRLAGLDDDGEFLVVAAHPDYGASYAKGVRMGDTDVEVTLLELGAIRGRAIAAEDGAPIRSFTVRVMKTMFLVLSAPVYQEVVTAEDGAFALRGITPGSYTLELEAAGRSTASKDVTFEAGDVDVGDVELTRGAVVAGVVQDQDGLPVRGALVRRRQGALADNPMLAMFRGGTESVRTDPEGRFRLGPLPPRRLQLLASADGYASGRSERLALEAGQVLDGVVIALGHGGTIEGRLTVGRGARLEDFLLMVQEQQTQVSATADIAGDGTFRVENLDPGIYQVQAMPGSLLQTFGGQNWRPGRGMDFGEMFQKITDNVVSQRCTVRAGETTEVALDAGEIVVGTRWTVRVEIGGKPLQTGIVEATATEGGRMRAGILVDGAAVFGNVEPGSYLVRVRSGISLAPVGAQQAIEFPAGKTEHSTTIALPGGALRGRVVDAATGAPLHAAVVRLVSEDATENDDPVGMALTDADGRFAFEGLADGSYGVVAAERLGEQQGTAARRGIAVVAGTTPAPIELRAQPAATASVLVTSPSGAPVAGATVLCVDREGRPLGALGIATTDQSGRAWFGGMPRGEARVVGRAPGLAPGASEVRQLDPSAPTEFLLTLTGGAVTTVQAVDGEGRPLAGATLTARCDGGPWLPAMLLVERIAPGSYRLGRLSPGAWEFRVSHPSTGTMVQPRTIGNEPAVTVVVAPN